MIKQFFYRSGKFFPPYFWITVLLFILVVLLILKSYYAMVFLFYQGRVEPLTFPVSDNLILGYLFFVLGWLAVYSKWGRDKAQEPIKTGSSLPHEGPKASGEGESP